MDTTSTEAIHTPSVSSISADDMVFSTSANARRSSRTKKPSKRYGDNDEDCETPLSRRRSLPPAAASASMWSDKKDRPKRKAAVAAAESIVPEDAGPLLQGILAEMTPDERKEYRGWVELESEPAFFNAMLQYLGAKDFKVQEVFGLDEMTLGELSQPVHGLIFLYQYSEGDESTEGRQECPDDLWFANQTTANACATVALMNIIMNAQGVAFGTELQKFRNATKAMLPPHRGHMLDINDFIRAVHNSVARRIDLTSEDLLLENKWEADEKRKAVTARGSSKQQKKTKKAAATQKKSTPPRKKVEIETAFHYIAYVPVNGQVWELDGLETQPLCVGRYDNTTITTTTAASSSSWLAVASPAIQNRMLHEAVSYNLLAVCQSPLSSILLSRTHSPPSSSPPFQPDQHQHVLPPDSTSTVLEAAQAAETAAVDEAVAMIRGRQRDYTPAIHEWVSVLAAKEGGVLRELISEIDAVAE